VEALDASYGSACALLENRASEVLDLRREPEAVRERYGRAAVGQSLLLACRLVEAGVSLVTVNWQDETKTDGANTCWDTHQDNFAKLYRTLGIDPARRYEDESQRLHPQLSDGRPITDLG
jgi:hypothetical protein